MFAHILVVNALWFRKQTEFLAVALDRCCVWDHNVDMNHSPVCRAVANGGPCYGLSRESDNGKKVEQSHLIRFRLISIKTSSVQVDEAHSGHAGDKIVDAST